MKLKTTVCINTGLYMDIRPEIEIEVPDGLKNQELVKWLHKEYHGLLTGIVSEVNAGNPIPKFVYNKSVHPEAYKGTKAKMYEKYENAKGAAELDTESLL